MPRAGAQRSVDRLDAPWRTAQQDVRRRRPRPRGGVRVAEPERPPSTRCVGHCDGDHRSSRALGPRQHVNGGAVAQVEPTSAPTLTPVPTADVRRAGPARGAAARCRAGCRSAHARRPRTAERRRLAVAWCARRRVGRRPDAQPRAIASEGALRTIAGVASLRAGQRAQLPPLDDRCLPRGPARARAAAQRARQSAAPLSRKRKQADPTSTA